MQHRMSPLMATGSADQQPAGHRLDPDRQPRPAAAGSPSGRDREHTRDRPRARVNAVLVALITLAATAGAVRAAPPTVTEMELASCVRGSPPLRVASTAERAMLDLPDRGRFQSAASQRYPLYARGGMVPTQVLMLRRSGQWQYVTVQPEAGGRICFTAVFAAERFDFTRAWIEKYRPRSAEPMD